MNGFEISLVIIGSLAAMTLLGAFICFMKVFYFPARKPLPDGEYDIPKGEIYEEFREDMVRWQKQLRELKYEQFEIRSRDGLTLRGKYYEYEKGAPLEIMFHGYEGNAERDLSGGVERCFTLKRNTIIVNQRAHGNSDGHVTTFGYKERLDCLDWIDFAIKRFGKEQKIIITGISMGAATVLMAAGEPLPDSVVCVLADCPYSSTREIISKIVREMHLPVKIIYPLIRLGAMIFGGFDPNKSEPQKAILRAKVPIIFVHGDTDDFVPAAMSEKMYKICPTEKALFLSHGAGHGLAFPKDQAGYYKAVGDFEKVWKKD